MEISKTSLNVVVSVSRSLVDGNLKGHVSTVEQYFRRESLLCGRVYPSVGTSSVRPSVTITLSSAKMSENENAGRDKTVNDLV